MSAKTTRVSFPLRQFVLVLALIACSFSALSFTGTLSSTAPNQEAVRERIASLVREGLVGKVTMVDGVRAETKIPPSPQAIKEIRDFGDEAVPVLTSYVGWPNVRERAAAVEFLGLLGGRRVAGPLQQVIKSDDAVAVRIFGLNWITEVPSELSLPILREASVNYSDREVREAAKNLLITCCSK